MMYHLKALIAAHRAKLAVAALGYALYNAIDPASSAHAGFAVAAVILMGLLVFVPAMLLAAHVDRVKPGKVEKPFKPVYVKRSTVAARPAGNPEWVEEWEATKRAGYSDLHNSIFGIGPRDLTNPLNVNFGRW